MLPSMLFLATLLGPVAHADAACADYAADPAQLVSLEADASRGALTDAQKDCLEASYAAAAEQTTKDKISRVLLVNAYAYSTQEWSRLVRRHLDEVDRSDPDIAYLYAFHLHHHDAEPEEVIRWTQVALERRDVWTGEVFVGRTYGLMKLRAVAARDAWQAAEEGRAGGQAAAQLDDLRNRTKTLAREWVDFAKSAGRDPAESLELCLSAAQRAVACGVDDAPPGDR